MKTTARFASDDAFLVWLGDLLAGDVEPRLLLQSVCETLAQHMRISRVGYGEVDLDAGLITIPDEWKDSVGPAVGQTQIIPGSEYISAYTRGETLPLSDWRAFPTLPEEEEILTAYGSTAMLTTPLMKSGKLVGLLAAMHHEVREWPDSEIQLIKRVGGLVQRAIDHARTLRSLRESEAQFRNLAENIPGICWLAGLDGRAYWMNRAGMEFHGSEATAYDNAEKLVHPDDYEDAMAIWTEARATGRPVEKRTRIRDSQGIYRPLLSRAQPIHDADGNIVRWIGLQFDMTEEGARNRSEDFLRDLSEQTRDTVDASDIVQVTAERLGWFLGAGRVAFTETDPADRSVFSVERDWTDDASPSVCGRWRMGDAYPRLVEAYNHGRTVVSHDSRADPMLDAVTVERLAAHSIRAGISVPLIRQGELVAVLLVQQASPRTWTKDEVKLVEDVAERTWAALNRARAEKQLIERERSQAILLTWSDSVRNVSNPRTILARTLALIGENLAVQRVNFAEADTSGEALVVEQDWVDGLDSVMGATFPLEALGKPVVEAHREGGPFRTDDSHEDARFLPETLAVYDSVGARAFVSIPLVRDGQLIAVLSVQQSTPRRWLETEVRLLTELAERTWAILERARSEERMAESEALLASFLENAPIAMYLKDSDGRYIRVNPVMGKVLSTAPENAIGKTAYDVVSRPIADQVTEMDRQAMEGGVHSVELSFPDRDTFASVLSIRFPIATRDGQVSKLGGFTIDLTEHRRAEAALQKSREALFQSEKLNALGSLLAGVSHELNNPLSIVVAQAVMLERQARGTELAERGYKIRKAADRCARIVQTFLAMARQKRPERDPVDLNSVVTAAVELADYGLRTDGITVEQDFADMLPVIAADRDQLHQVIINLIINAQQAMVDAQTAERKLNLRTRPGLDNTVVFDIIDSGPGVPLEIGRRIFEPFFTTKPQGQGTGVGLSFSQGLAEAHGGRLELIDCTAGAHFRLTLPVHAAQAADETPEEGNACAPSRRCALIVDDEREIAESLADFLGLEGFDCEIVGGGAQAQARLKAHDYDLVLSDIRMPGMDGPQLYAWLQNERPDLEARIAFVTGDTLGSAAARFIAETRRPVLEKPFMPGGVRRLLKQMELA